MRAVTINGNLSTTVIYCYNPTNDSDGMVLDTFYNELSSHVYSIPKHNVLSIGGDMNAQIDLKKKQIQLPQLVQQKWWTPGGLHTWKWINMP